MDIVLDGLLLFLNNGQIGDYSRSIVDNLIKYTTLKLSIIKDYEIDSSAYKNCSIELLLNRKLNDYSNLSNYLNYKKNSIYHCLNNGFSIPKNFEYNYIININNLLPIICENLCPINYVSNFFNKVPYGVLKSSYIITPSITTKQNFLKSFSLNSDKVFINYGVISSFYNKTDRFLSSVYIKSKFNIEGKFIVFCGDFHPRKNLDKAIILFKNLKRYISDLKFLILSFKFEDINYLDKLNRLSNKLNICNDVVFLDNISVVDKVNIFSNALFFLDLSTYEDVNIGIVEAFNCKTPIVCSNISLYKEYFGDLVFYYKENIDPLTIIDFACNYSYNESDFVLNKFDKNLNLNTLINIYKSLEL